MSVLRSMYFSPRVKYLGFGCWIVAGGFFFRIWFVFGLDSARLWLIFVLSSGYNPTQWETNGNPMGLTSQWEPNGIGVAWLGLY